MPIASRASSSRCRGGSKIAIAKSPFSRSAKRSSHASYAREHEARVAERGVEPQRGDAARRGCRCGRPARASPRCALLDPLRHDRLMLAVFLRRHPEVLAGEARGALEALRFAVGAAMAEASRSSTRAGSRSIGRPSRFQTPDDSAHFDRQYTARNPWPLSLGIRRWPPFSPAVPPRGAISTSRLMSCCAFCEEEDLSALMYQRLTESGSDGWPRELRETLGEHARRRAGEELLRASETREVIDALARAGVGPILIKGTPLAYAWYDTPASRPRDDTDVLVPAAQVETARGVLASLDYVTTVYCDDLFSQFEVQKTDRFGMMHAFDVHWSISTQPAFANVLTYDEVLAAERAGAGARRGGGCAGCGRCAAPGVRASGDAPPQRRAWAVDLRHPPSCDRRSRRPSSTSSPTAPRRRESRRSARTDCGSRRRSSRPPCPPRSSRGSRRPGPLNRRRSTWRQSGDGTTSSLSSIRGLPSLGERVRLLRSGAVSRCALHAGAPTVCVVSRWVRGCCPCSTCTATCTAPGRFCLEKSEIMPRDTWQQ